MTAERQEQVTKNQMPGQVDGAVPLRRGVRLIGAAVTACLFTSLLCAGWAAQAEEGTTQVWVTPGFYSQHFHSGGNFRSDNIGLGGEVVISPDHAVLAGSFINSDGARSHYGAYWWRPLHWGLKEVGVHAGVVAAALDGYPNYRTGGWFVAPIPAVAIEGSRVGLNVLLVPTIKNRVQGAVALQLKIRAW